MVTNFRSYIFITFLFFRSESFFTNSDSIKLIDYVYIYYHIRVVNDFSNTLTWRFNYTTCITSIAELALLNLMSLPSTVFMQLIHKKKTQYKPVFFSAEKLTYWYDG